MHVLGTRFSAWHVGRALLHGVKSGGLEPAGPGLASGPVSPAAPDVRSSCRESSTFIPRGRKLLPLHHQRGQFSALLVPLFASRFGSVGFQLHAVGFQGLPLHLQGEREQFQFQKLWRSLTSAAGITYLCCNLCRLL